MLDGGLFERLADPASALVALSWPSSARLTSGGLTRIYETRVAPKR